MKKTCVKWSDPIRHMEVLFGDNTGKGSGRRLKAGDVEEVYIYGAGNIGREVHAILTGRGLQVRAFIDRKGGNDRRWNGIPVLSLAHEGLDCSLPVVIAIFNPEVNITTLVADLFEFGFLQILTFFDFFNEFSDQIGTRYWLCEEKFYHDKLDAIGEASGLWGDEKSMLLYQSVLEFRVTGNATVAPLPDSSVQYFPDDIPGLKKPHRFIDCGAFDGDTIRSLLSCFKTVEAVAAFEPDKANYGRLVETVLQLRAKLPRNVSLFPCGLWTESLVMRIAEGGGASAALSGKDGAVVQCVALDEALPGWEPDFIKMDIEGAEYEALNGALKLIDEFRPILAVSVYHRPEDLWAIPLFIRSLGGYKLFLRSHAYSTFDTVMYAIPDERGS